MLLLISLMNRIYPYPKMSPEIALGGANKMKTVKLSKGQFALVDDADFECINRFIVTEHISAADNPQKPSGSMPTASGQSKDR